MLSLHEAVPISEALFIMILYSKYAKYKNMNKKRIHSFYKYLWIEKCMNRWKIHKEELKKDLMEMDRNAYFSELYRIIYYHYAKDR